MRIPDADEVFVAVAAIVERGEYLDEIPGVPEVNPSGGGAFKVLPDGRRCRLYTRNSPDYLAARSAGKIEPLPSPPHRPATASEVDEAEELVGHSMPLLLRRLYLEVGNGGFGPGYGILGLRGGHGVPPDGRALDRYAQAASNPTIGGSLVPVCDWGCAIESYVDWADPDGRMWGLDPNPTGEVELALHPQEMRLVDWLAHWVEGRLYQPWVVKDPDSGEWRCATNAETEAALAEEV